MLHSNMVCPVCDADFIAELQPIYLQRQQTTVPQFYCMTCESFFHRSSYKEPEGQFVGDTRWLINHPGDYKKALYEVRSIFPKAVTFFEAGCGVGDLLMQARDAGLKGQGVDPNPLAVEHAKTSRKVDAAVGYFNKLDKPVDLIFSIDVLEHLETPRTFFADLVASVKPKGGIMTRVPTVDRNRWQFLRSAGSTMPKEPEDPFMDNSVHITHFSTQGFVTMAQSLGAKFIKKIDQDIMVFAT